MVTLNVETGMFEAAAPAGEGGGGDDPPKPPPEDNRHAYGRALAEKGALVYHTPTAAIGRVVGYHTGAEGDRYTSPMNGQEVPTPVLLLDSGHALTFPSESVLIELEPNEATLFAAFQGMLGQTLKTGAGVAAGLNVVPRTAFLIIVAMLRQQANLLEAQAAQLPGS